MEVQKTDELGMEFEWGMKMPVVNSLSPDFYLRATEGGEKTDFIATISHGVTVANMSTPIQAWRKAETGTDVSEGTKYQNTMTFNDELSLNNDPIREFQLIKSKSNIIFQ